MMKRALPLIAFLLGLAFTIQAQSDLRFGFQASPTITWMVSNDKKINGSGSNLGIKLGLRGEYFFSERYALTGGFNFAFNQGGELAHEQGGRYWSNSDLSEDFYKSELSDGVKLRYGIQYVELPVGFKLLTGEIFRDLRFFFEIPVFTFSFETQARGAIEDSMLPNTDNENISADVNPFMISWGFGGGAEYNLSGSSDAGTNLMFGLYYNNGFTDITRDKNAVKLIPTENGVEEEPEDSTGAIHGLQLFLGIRF